MSPVIPQESQVGNQWDPGQNEDNNPDDQIFKHIIINILKIQETDRRDIEAWMIYHHYHDLYHLIEEYYPNPLEIYNLTNYKYNGTSQTLPRTLATKLKIFIEWISTTYKEFKGNLSNSYLMDLTKSEDDTFRTSNSVMIPSPGISPLSTPGSSHTPK